MNRGFYINNTTSSSWNTTWFNGANIIKGTSDLWICTTGATEQNKVLNIYDFAGNTSEWTLEGYFWREGRDPVCVYRGGHGRKSEYVSTYQSNATSFSAVDRYPRETVTREYYVSARPSLCIK